MTFVLYIQEISTLPPKQNSQNFGNTRKPPEGRGFLAAASASGRVGRINFFPILNFRTEMEPL